MDILERITFLAIAMLILSLIVEKLANFWKLHGDQDMRLPQIDPSDEKNREKSFSERL
jgi:hypothetical protein